MRTKTKKDIIERDGIKDKVSYQIMLTFNMFLHKPKSFEAWAQNMRNFKNHFSLRSIPEFPICLTERIHYLAQFQRHLHLPLQNSQFHKLHGHVQMP
jgi:hypothetical protein